VPADGDAAAAGAQLRHDHDGAAHPGRQGADVRNLFNFKLTDANQDVRVFLVLDPLTTDS
jgi:hypothetical protein